MPQTLNAKGRPFSWSYTALAEYKNCPYKYAHNRFYCTIPFIESVAMQWGSRVHKAAEDYLKQKPVPDTEALKPVEKYVKTMLTCGCEVQAEFAITLTEDFTPTKWFAKDAWLRAKIDVLIIAPGTYVDSTTASNVAKLFDWKTGKNIRNDPDQLRLNAAMLSTVRPDFELFSPAYIWTAHQQTCRVNDITREQIPSVWQEFLPTVAAMQQAWDTEDFPATPSGLCPWCAVKNCGKRRGVMR